MRSPVPSGQSEAFTGPGLSEKPVNKEMDPKGSQWFPKVPLPPQLMVNFAGEVLVLLRGLALDNMSTPAIPLGAITHQGWQAQEKPPTALYKCPVLGNRVKSVGTLGISDLLASRIQAGDLSEIGRANMDIPARRHQCVHQSCPSCGFPAQALETKGESVGIAPRRRAGQEEPRA